MVIFMAEKNFFEHGSNLHFRTPIVIADHIPEYKKIRSGAKKVRAKKKILVVIMGGAPPLVIPQIMTYLILH